MKLFNGYGWVLAFIALVFFDRALAGSDEKILSVLPSPPGSSIADQVGEDYSFYGLASHYNSLSYYLVDSYQVRKLIKEETISLAVDQRLAVVGRFKVFLISGEGTSLRFDGLQLSIDHAALLVQQGASVEVVSKSALQAISPVLDQLRYAHLWPPLAQLSKLVEWALTKVHSAGITNWGWVLVIFSLLLKLLLLPVSMMTLIFQRRVSQVQTALEPVIADIKARYDGEQAHNLLMAAHREQGVTPFYTLKPMLGSFVQIPVLIAVFNALGEMGQFNHESFLWIDNLAYPDVVGQLSVGIPMIGDAISLLPLLMTLITVWATVAFQNRHASVEEVKRQKRNLFFMAAAFLILFYPFPAVMVLYWTLANLFQVVQQQLIKI